MTSIADQLRALADQLDKVPVAPVDPPVPAGFVLVKPTGVNAKGVSRLYPTPESFGRGSSWRELNLWGYYTLATSKIVGPYTFSGSSKLATDFANFPEAVDRIEHPEDWATQEDIDLQAKLKARDVGAHWVSVSDAPAPAPPPAPEAPTDVPITNE